MVKTEQKRNFPKMLNALFWYQEGTNVLCIASVELTFIV